MSTCSVSCRLHLSCSNWSISIFHGCTNFLDKIAYVCLRSCEFRQFFCVCFQTTLSSQISLPAISNSTRYPEIRLRSMANWYGLGERKLTTKTGDFLLAIDSAEWDQKEKWCGRMYGKWRMGMKKRHAREELWNRPHDNGQKCSRKNFYWGVGFVTFAIVSKKYMQTTTIQLDGRICCYSHFIYRYIVTTNKMRWLQTLNERMGIIRKGQIKHKIIHKIGSSAAEKRRMRREQSKWTLWFRSQNYSSNEQICKGHEQCW